MHKMKIFDSMLVQVVFCVFIFPHLTAFNPVNLAKKIKIVYNKKRENAQPGGFMQATPCFASCLER